MKILLFPALLLLCLACAMPAYSATFVVDTVNDTIDASPYDGLCLDAYGQCSLRAAVTESNIAPGPNTVQVPAGTYLLSVTGAGENGNNAGDLDISNSVNILGAGASVTIIQGAPAPGIGSDRVFDIVNSIAVVTIDGVTISNGTVNGAPGGGIRSVGNLTLSNSDVLSNSAYPGSGGGIYSEGNLTISDSNVNYNRCWASGTCSGGGIMARPRAGLSFSMFRTNVLFNEANFSPSASGTPQGNGGGVAVNGMGAATVTFDQTSISVNRAGGPTSMGAGLWVRSDSGATSITFSGSYACQNFFSQGDGTFGAGVGLYTVLSGTISANITDVNFVANDDPSPSFSWPYSGTMGGALAIRSNGGMITANLKKSSMFYNRARRGGGIAITNGGGNPSSGVNFTATNTTVALNTVNGPSSATTGAYGAGVYLERPYSGGGVMSATLDFCTLMENSGTNPAVASNGGGIYHPGIVPGTLTATLRNTVVSNNKWNAANNDLRGHFSSPSYNHFGTLVPASFSGPFVNNSGGPLTYSSIDQTGHTWFYLFVFGGPPLFNAIPNGTNGCGTTILDDQRSIARPQWGACDKGAVEQ